MSDLMLYVPGPLVSEVYLQLGKLQTSIREAELSMSGSGLADAELPRNCLERLQALEDSVYRITGPIKVASRRAHERELIRNMPSEEGLL